MELVKFEVQKPDEVECEMTICMKLGAWKKISEDLSDNHPSWEFAQLIKNKIDRMEKDNFELIESKEITKKKKGGKKSDARTK